MISTDEVNKSNISENTIKRLLELSRSEGELVHYPDGRVYRNDELVAEDPTEEQEEWVERIMKGSARSWERWFVGHYFTEEQKKELELTDEDIAGRGMK